MIDATLVPILMSFLFQWRPWLSCQVSSLLAQLVNLGFIIWKTRLLYFQDQSTNQAFNKTDNLNQEQFQSLILEEIARYYWRNLNLPITLTTCFWLIIVLNHLKTFTCSLFKLETGRACSKGRRRLQVRTISAREIRWPTWGKRRLCMSNVMGNFRSHVRKLKKFWTPFMCRIRQNYPILILGGASADASGDASAGK